MRGSPGAHSEVPTSPRAGRYFASTAIILPVNLPSRAASTVSKTLLRSVSTSACHNRNTDQPFLFIVSSLNRSDDRSHAGYHPPQPPDWPHDRPNPRSMAQLATGERTYTHSVADPAVRAKERLQLHCRPCAVHGLAWSFARFRRTWRGPSSALRAPSPSERGEGDQAFHNPFAFSSSISRVARSRSLTSRSIFDTAASSDLSE